MQNMKNFQVLKHSIRILTVMTDYNKLPDGFDDFVNRSGRTHEEVLAIYARHFDALSREASAAVKNAQQNSIGALAYRATMDEVLKRA